MKSCPICYEYLSTSNVNYSPVHIIHVQYVGISGAINVKEMRHVLAVANLLHVNMNK